MQEQNDPERFEILMDLNKISKKELLSIGWKSSLLELFIVFQILTKMINRNIKEKK